MSDYIQKLEAQIYQLQDHIEELEVALRDIQAKAMQVKPPRFSWFYDRAEEALKKCK